MVFLTFIHGTINLPFQNKAHTRLCYAKINEHREMFFDSSKPVPVFTMCFTDSDEQILLTVFTTVW